MLQTGIKNYDVRGFIVLQELLRSMQFWQAYDGRGVNKNSVVYIKISLFLAEFSYTVSVLLFGIGIEGSLRNSLESDLFTWNIRPRSR